MLYYLIIIQPSTYTPHQSKCFSDIRKSTSKWSVMWLWVLTVITSDIRKILKIVCISEKTAFYQHVWRSL